MCYTKIFSRIKYFFFGKILFDTVDDVQKMMLENIAFERRNVFYKTGKFTRKSLPCASGVLIDWTVTNEPRLIARSNIRQQKPSKAYIADP